MKLEKALKELIEKTDQELSDQYGGNEVMWSTTRTCLRRLGVPMGSKKASKEERKARLKSFVEGLSAEQMAKRHGTTLQTMERWIARNIRGTQK